MENVKRKTSMQDIASALGISKNAVSLALNNKSGISDTLRNKVIQMAIEMNYGGYGKLNAQSENNLIAICVPSAIGGFSQFYSIVYWSVEQALGEQGYRTLLTSVTQDMEQNLELPQVLQESHVTGVVVVGILSKQFVQKLSKQFEHIVLIDNNFVDLPLNSVVTAHAEGGYEATSCLLSQGFRNIGFVGNIARYHNYYERYQGYRLALEESSLPIDESRIFTDRDLYLPTLQVDLVAQRTISLGLDALFCACDRDAIQLIGKFHTLGISIPEELSIIGFDDVENADIITPPLTTMRVPRRDLGLKAAHMLIDQIEKRTHSRLAISVYPQLIIRSSVKMFVK